MLSGSGHKNAQTRGIAPLQSSDRKLQYQLSPCYIQQKKLGGDLLFVIHLVSESPTALNGETHSRKHLFCAVRVIKAHVFCQKGEEK